MMHEGMKGHVGTHVHAMLGCEPRGYRGAVGLEIGLLRDVLQTLIKEQLKC